MSINYKAPIDGIASSIDDPGSEQFHTFYWIRKALLEAEKERVFSLLSGTEGIPKHYGKTVKKYHYMPLLDDRNVNDQGLDATGATISNGNLWGSSRDVGTIAGRLPVLSENGGRVNRVGFSRKTIEGSIFRLGFFYEWSDESMDFDTDAQLKQHLSRESIIGATKMNEDIIQMDLLNGAGTVMYAGAALDMDEITGEEDAGNPRSEVTLDDLSRMDEVLSDNNAKYITKIAGGSTKVDTRTIPASRVIYIGPELKRVVRGMKDAFGKQAFIGVHQYAGNTAVFENEIGIIDNFRIIEVREMEKYEASGAEVTNNPGYRVGTDKAGKSRYNVYPMLVIGDDSFTCLGFQSHDGKSAKFNIISKQPGRDTAHQASDPYGTQGFSSIQWWYGMLIERPERIGVIYTVAPI